jgi:1-acyl-sn-glycerol-3-phosphate acyltransferase
MMLIRSLVYNTIFYALMPVIGLIALPYAIVNRDGAQWAIHTFCRITLWLLPVICGTRVEVRGKVPEGEVIVAAKHQSFLDIVLIANALKRPKFIMKKQLKWAPILGFYAWRMGCYPIDRGKRGQAIQEMVAKVREERRDPGQLVIYPQGTRTQPGAKVGYKIGTGVLYEEFGLDVYPVSTNAGLFWGRNKVLRKPGLAVVEFLEPIPGGLDRKDFMATLEERIETSSEALLAEGRKSLTH